MTLFFRNSLGPRGHVCTKTNGKQKQKRPLLARPAYLQRRIYYIRDSGNCSVW